MKTELKGLEDYGLLTAGALGAAWDEVSGAGQ